MKFNHNCKDCGIEFKRWNTLQVRCYECQRKSLNERQRNRKPHLKKCKECGNEFNGRLGAKFCSKECSNVYQSKNRNGKSNPCYRNGLSCRDNRVRTGERGLIKYRQKVIESMIDDVGHPYCQKCNTSNSFRWEMHHIVFRSEAPSHKNLHDDKNGVLCCIMCHNLFHKKKKERDYLIIERNLWELFPEYIRKENYITIRQKVATQN